MQPLPELAVRCGRLYDGTAAAPQTNVTLLVRDGRIAEIRSGDEPPQAQTVLTADSVTPGLINAHVHLDFSGEPDAALIPVVQSPTALTLIAAANARRSLEAGVTTVRDLGSAGTNAIEVRNAVDRGTLVGPSIVPAGRALCMTGGHGHFIGRETDGPWDVRKAVREQLKAGATCIKLIATGGVLTRGAVPGQDQLSEEEMRAAVMEARTHGMRVAAHAIGTNGILNALRAGVDSIEHGHLLDDAAIELFRSRNAALVPTIAAVTCIFEHASDGTQPDFVVRKATALYEAMRENIGRAYRAGVTIAGGSDAGTPYNYHHAYAYEVELMQTILGMSAVQALHAATETAGSLLGVEAGLLRPGRPADFLLLAGSLQDNTLALRAPLHVFKAARTSAHTALNRFRATICKAASRNSARAGLSIAVVFGPNDGDGAHFRSAGAARSALFTIVVVRPLRTLPIC